MRSTPRSHAFTLVELLAAIAILAILMTLVFSAYNQTARVWTIAERRTEAFQNARLVLDMMGRELEAAIAETNQTTGKTLTFLSTANATDVPLTPSQLSATPPNDQLFWITTQGEAGGTSYCLNEVGYFVAFANSSYQSMKSNQYYLIRHFVRSDWPAFNVFSAPTTWMNTGDYSLTGTKSPILDNVLRLEFRFEARDSTSNTSGSTNGTRICEEWSNRSNCPDCDPNCALARDFQDPTLPASSSGYFYRDRDPQVTLPRAVHIRLAVLDRRYANRLSALRPSGMTSTELGMIIPNCQGQDINSISDATLASTLREGVHIFYKTVYLRNAF